MARTLFRQGWHYIQNLIHHLLLSSIEEHQSRLPHKLEYLPSQEGHRSTYFASGWFCGIVILETWQEILPRAKNPKFMSSGGKICAYSVKKQTHHMSTHLACHWTPRHPQNSSAYSAKILVYTCSLT